MHSLLRIDWPTFLCRTAHSESTQRRLTEAAAKEEELRARCALDETELADLRARLSTLETDLEAMQINVEEVR